jgi:DNA modification methylase
MLTLKNTDCANYIDKLNNYTLLLTDPPWGADVQNVGTLYEYDDGDHLWDRVFYRVTEYAKKAKVVAIACDDRWMPSWHVELRKLSFSTRTLVIKSELGGVERNAWPIKHYYYVLCYRNNQPEYFNREALPMIPRHGNLRADVNTYHPTMRYVAGVLDGTISPTDGKRVRGFQGQKCEKVMESIIRTHCQPGNLVIDPFMGTGSSAVAAKNVGFVNYFGVELNANTFWEAQKRIE